MKATLSAWFIDISSRIVSRLPLAWRKLIIRALGTIYGSYPHAQRLALEKNLTLFLNIKGDELKKTVKIIFQNFVITLYDFFHPKGLLLAVPERAELEALRKKYGGILFLTFHMGNWELGARTMQEWGWPVTAVYQPYENKKFKELIEAHRAPGVNFVPVGGKATHAVREALRRGDVVAMLGDHAFGEEGIPVNLLGHRVLWPKGPILLAIREKAPIVIAVIVRTSLRHYKAIVLPAIISHERTRAEIHRVVQDVATKFGELLKDYPTQWYRFRDFDFLPNETANETSGKKQSTDELNLLSPLQ